jgi:CBS domain-containing protein
MTVGKYCNREVIIISESESIRDAALLMREYHIGDLVVVQGEVEKRIPVGILTDRDIVVEIDAMSVDPDNVSVGDALSFELVTIGEDADIQAAIHIMRTKGVRRLPVVDKDGILVGILTVDDVIDLLTEQFVDLSRLFSLERRHEQERRQ